MVRSAEEIPWEGEGAAERSYELPNGTRVETRTLRIGYGGIPGFGRLVTDFRFVDTEPPAEGEVVDDKKDEK